MASLSTNNGYRPGVADEIKRQTEAVKKREDQQARHKVIIRGILEKTARLRKDSKARRHRVSDKAFKQLPRYKSF